MQSIQPPLWDSFEAIIPNVNAKPTRWVGHSKQPLIHPLGRSANLVPTSATPKISVVTLS